MFTWIQISFGLQVHNYCGQIIKYFPGFVLLDWMCSAKKKRMVFCLEKFNPVRFRANRITSMDSMLHGLAYNICPITMKNFHWIIWLYYQRNYYIYVRYCLLLVVEVITCMIAFYAFAFAWYNREIIPLVRPASRTTSFPAASRRRQFSITGYKIFCWIIQPTLHFVFSAWMMTTWADLNSRSVTRMLAGQTASEAWHSGQWRD